ncbi:zinc finger CCHC domain-containing protein 13-like [Drosophila innubila]|uniref:zinc finger CCHC domain-containing protein 13-like n=1 Tax=Drosophila innubila TaxID=198719 RepID=UPI00148B965E|nr:zinc finger CCHC domain-containing protein 13-like [Drosophila innubila]XP_034475588.1 zinc finger CCHC domain-containing protein 13-like [Drosophila innubila]
MSRPSNGAMRTGAVQKTATPDQKVTKCFNCNSFGHMAAECRKPKRDDGACFACGKLGHRAKECSLYKKTKLNDNYSAS